MDISSVVCVFVTLSGAALVKKVSENVRNNVKDTLMENKDLFALIFLSLSSFILAELNIFKLYSFYALPKENIGTLYITYYMAGAAGGPLLCGLGDTLTNKKFGQLIFAFAAISSILHNSTDFSQLMLARGSQGALTSALLSYLIKEVSRRRDSERFSFEIGMITSSFSFLFSMGLSSVLIKMAPNIFWILSKFSSFQAPAAEEDNVDEDGNQIALTLLTQEQKVSFVSDAAPYIIPFNVAMIFQVVCLIIISRSSTSFEMKARIQDIPFETLHQIIQGWVANISSTANLFSMGLLFLSIAGAHLLSLSFTPLLEFDSDVKVERNPVLTLFMCCISLGSMLKIYLSENSSEKVLIFRRNSIIACGLFMVIAALIEGLLVRILSFAAAMIAFGFFFPFTVAMEHSVSYSSLSMVFSMVNLLMAVALLKMQQISLTAFQLMVAGCFISGAFLLPGKKTEEKIEEKV